MVIRNILYDYGICKIYKLPCLVISVGNITIGGTGKTPTVVYLTDWLMQKGYTVAILSRGYKRESRGTVIVSDGISIKTTQENAGDEPFMLAQKTGTIIVVDTNRVRGGKIIVDKFAPDVLILDDGFQHRRLYRDIDIATFNAANPFGNGFCVPAGPLREFRFHLKRANLYWFNSTNGGQEKLPRSRSSIQTVYSRYTVAGFYHFDHSRVKSDLENRKCVAFCGIANPQNFRNTLTETKIKIVRFIDYIDHHKFTLNDIYYLENIYKNTRADYMITTEKDWIKLPSNYKYKSNWLFLKIEIKPKNQELMESILSDLIINRLNYS